MTCLMVKKMAENSSKDGAYGKVENGNEIENETQMEAKNVPILLFIQTLYHLLVNGSLISTAVHTDTVPSPRQW